MRSVAGESAELRVVVADGVGEGLDCLPEGREFVGERGDAAVRGGLLVVLDCRASDFVAGPVACGSDARRSLIDHGETDGRYG